jgi:ABC-type glycerol-3-phosphate transport system substrate-binding protein
LDTEALRKYLNTIKAISDKLRLMDESPIDGSRVMTSVSTSDGASNELLPGSLTRYFMQQTNYAAFIARNLMILQVAMDNRSSDLKLFPGFDPGVWQPSVITGISADTERADLAAELVQTMLSLDVQKLSYGTGLPVTRAGMSAQTEALNNDRIRSNMEMFDFDIDPLMSQLKTVSLSDTVIKDMIWGIVERLCKGDIDVDGAVREIEQSIRTYLAERG